MVLGNIFVRNGIFSKEKSNKKGKIYPLSTRNSDEDIS